MAEVFRTDVVFNTTDELTAKLNSIVSALRGADRAAKTFQSTLNSFKVGRIGLPPLDTFRQHGMAAGRSFAEGFASAAAAGVRRGMEGVAAAAGRAAGAASAGAMRGARAAAGLGGGLVPYSAGGGGGSEGNVRGAISATPRALGYAGNRGLPVPGGAEYAGYNGGGFRYGPQPGGGGFGPPGVGAGFDSAARGFGGAAAVSGGGRGGGGQDFMGQAPPPPYNYGPQPPPGGGGGGGGSPPRQRGSPLGALAGGYVLEQEGRSILGHVGHLAREGMAYQAAVSNLATQGFTPDEQASAARKAWETSRNVPTSGVTENVRTVGELRYALGTPEHAETALEAVTKMTAVLQAFSGGNRGAKEAYSGARALEMAGRANTSDQFQGGLNNMTRAIVGSGGKVTADHFLGFSQQAGSQNTPSMSDAFLFNVMPRVMQEMGGMRAGTGYAAIMRQFIGGTASKKSLEAMADAGLLVGGHSAIVGKGVQTHLAPGGLRDADLAASNFYEYLQKNVAPQMINMKPAERQQFLGRLFSTGPAQREAAILLGQGRVLGGGANSGVERDSKIISNVPANAYGSIVANNPQNSMTALSTSWSNFTTALGATVTPIIVPALKMMTGALGSMAAWANDNPKTVATILRVIGGLGVMFTVMGTVAIAVGTVALLFSAGGAFGGAMVAVGAAAGVAAAFIDKIPTSFAGMISGIKSAISTLSFGAIKFGDDLNNARKDARNSASPVTGHPGASDFLKPGDGINMHPSNISYHPSASGAARTTPIILTLDGRVVARSTLRHVGDELGGPLSGGGSYDGTVMPMQPGMRNI